MGPQYIIDTDDYCPECGERLVFVEEEIGFGESGIVEYYRCPECEAEFDLDSDRSI